MERLNKLSAQLTAGIPAPNHPLDPLSPTELAEVVKVVKSTYPDKTLFFNTVTLREPSHDAITSWLTDKSTVIPREAFFVVLQPGQPGLFDGFVNLSQEKVTEFVHKPESQPIITAEDLATTEAMLRTDSGIIEQCRISGIPLEDMKNIYCDPWTVGHDEIYGNTRRLQQAIMYYRSDPDDFQYSHALDFCPIIDTELKKVLYIKVPEKRRPLSKAPHPNFYPKDIEARLGFRTDIKPIKITQPEGVSFTMDGNVIRWQNYEFHIGINYREGLVLSNVRYFDKYEGKTRSMFRRLSLADMIVPYGNPHEQHPMKHAIDGAEYGLGNSGNSLGLGCDCVGKIHYLDWSTVERDGSVRTLKNAICIHEEDNGLLFKHADFRDGFQTSLTTRARRLIVSQVATVGNYTYCFYWSFHQDGTIQLEVKLTGILNTYVCTDDEKTEPYGTKVYPGVNAHHHQHLFCLRIEPEIDGLANSAAMADSARTPLPVGHPENKWGNGFYPERTVFKTVADSVTNYDGSTSRSWDLFNPNKLHPYSGKPVSYKLVSRECPPMLAQPGSLVAGRGAFAQNTVTVVPYRHGEVSPTGLHVPQSSGKPPIGLPEYVGDGTASIENTDIVLYHTFGITHFPAPEDFPIMPAEACSLLLRPRNFFLMNPALDVPPSYAVTGTEVRARKNGNSVMFDKESELAFVDGCCKK